MTNLPTSNASRPRVVIVGAGFGGLAAARGLAGTPVDVTIIDRTNHNLFQPLLYQVGTAALAPSDIAVPIRGLFSDRPEVTVYMDEVTAVDADSKVVTTVGNDRIRFDYLVLATGSVYSWFGHDEWAARAHVLKTLDDALRLRNSLLAAFEHAENQSDEIEIRRLLTFVVVGGGPTGVELAGAIAELAHSTLSRDFRHIRPTAARIVLCEAGPTLLPGFPSALSQYAQRKLEDLHVEVLTKTAVQSVDHEGVVAGDQRIPSANILWCAGTKATPAADWIGAPKDRQGRVVVQPDCSAPDHPDIFAIGDLAFMTGKNGRPLPGVGPVAKQQGAHVAKVIASRVTGGPTPTAFAYKDAGQLAMVGRSSAVAELKRVELKGFVAWVLWSAVHLFFLIGARNRLAVYLNWVWAWMTYGRGARLITRLEPHADDGRAASPIHQSNVEDGMSDPIAR
jgi:NADH dehydrogenase